MSSPSATNEKRRRVLRTQITSAWSGAGSVSCNIQAAIGLAQQQVYVACSTTPTAGKVQVLVRPAKSGFYVVVGTIDLSLNGSGQVMFPGLIDSVQLTFTTALASGTVTAGVISTGVAYTPTGNRSEENRRRFGQKLWNAWNGVGALTVDGSEQSGFAQHQFAITGGTGNVALYGRPTGSGVFCLINSDTTPINSAGALVLFPGMYDAFEVRPIGTVSGTIQMHVASCGEEMFLPVTAWQVLNTFGSVVTSFNGRSGPVVPQLGDYTPSLLPPILQLGLKNRLINGNFDWWQRATTLTVTAATNVYCADRWKIQTAGDTGTVTQQTFTPGQGLVPNEPTYFMRCAVTSVAGANNYFLTSQYIEDVRSFAGQTVTLSFWAKAATAQNIAIEFLQNFGTGGSSILTGIGSQLVALTTSWQQFSVTVSIPSISGKTIGAAGTHYLFMYVWMDAGSTYSARTAGLGQQSGTFDFSQAQLEYGSYATLFDIRPQGMELALCQRYYEKSYEAGITPGTVASITGTTQARLAGLPSGTYTPFMLTFYRVTKRAIPTLTVYSYDTATAGAIYDSSNGFDVTPTIISSATNNHSLLATAHAANTSYSMIYHWTADADF